MGPYMDAALIWGDFYLSTRIIISFFEVIMFLKHSQAQMRKDGQWRPRIDLESPRLVCWSHYIHETFCAALNNIRWDRDHRRRSDIY